MRCQWRLRLRGATAGKKSLTKRELRGRKKKKKTTARKSQKKKEKEKDEACRERRVRKKNPLSSLEFCPFSPTTHTFPDRVAQ